MLSALNQQGLYYGLDAFSLLLTEADPDGGPYREMDFITIGQVKVQFL